MDKAALLDGLICFFGFIGFVALHEFAHAWTAVRCGDDTPRLQGRLTLDPIAHIDLIGTIILPLALVLLGAASGQVFLFGWGKPVQVNLNNFRVRRRDDILVSVAGPIMNLLIAIVMLGGMRLGILAGISLFESDSFLRLTQLTMFLCFFNLLPIPPLDGGHIMRNLVGISDEAYAEISRYSFLFFILIMRVPAISETVNLFAANSVILLGRVFGFDLALQH
jgi:Zn-dependent protease